MEVGTHAVCVFVVLWLLSLLRYFEETDGKVVPSGELSLLSWPISRAVLVYFML